jgi:Coenzyme PQQ synthesis protein D (PqqD)
VSDASETALLKPNRPDVLDEVFEGEAVLVNLATGRYYAMDDSASEVWTAIVQGSSWPDLVDAFAAAREASRDGAETALAGFAQRLLDEQLVVLTGMLPEPADGAGGGELPAEPRLEVFTDMEDLLLLDPIHDIDLDGTGWPQAPASTPS